MIEIVGQKNNRSLNPLIFLEDAARTTIESHNERKYSLLIKPFIPFKGPSARNVPGIINVPLIKVTRKVYGCRLNICGPKVYPANDFSHHQSQGSTFDRCVVSINESCNSYGLANVFTSRTPKPQNFSITSPVTLRTLQPSP